MGLVEINCPVCFLDLAAFAGVSPAACTGVALGGAAGAATALALGAVGCAGEPLVG